MTTYTAEEKTVMDALLADIGMIRDEIGEDIPLVISISQKVKTILEKDDKFAKRLDVADFKAGVINTRLKQIDNCYLKPVPSARMKTSYVFRDGKSEGQEDGGFAPGESSKQINWIITAQDAPIAVTKQDKMKIIDPETYQKADAWFIGYRRYHELWYPENRYKKGFVNAEG